MSKDSRRPKYVVLNQSIKDEIRSFITSIALNMNNSDTNFSTSGLFFGNDNEGYVSLDQSEAQEFREILFSITEGISSFSPISRKFVVEAFQATILESLAITGTSHNKNLDQRIDQAISNLQSTLHKGPIEFIVYYPIFGLSDLGLPFNIGNVEFFILQEDTLDEINESYLTRNPSANKQEIINSFNIANLVGRTFAKLHVLSNDKDAAERIAINEIRYITDIINFFVDLVPYSTNSFLYLPGDSNRELVFHALRRKDQVASTMGERIVGPISTVSYPRLMETDAEHNIGFHIMCSILSQKTTNLQGILLNAIRWAGKASMNHALGHEEQAFLFYTIALESIILCDNDRDELRYRLSLRIAHLLGSSGQSRPGIAKLVKDLYDIRSKIVHNGNFEIVDTDLSSLRFIVKSCLIHLLRDDPFTNMKSPQDLQIWFDQQIFG